MRLFLEAVLEDVDPALHISAALAFRSSAVVEMGHVTTPTFFRKRAAEDARRQDPLDGAGGVARRSPRVLGVPSHDALGHLAADRLLEASSTNRALCANAFRSIFLDRGL